MGRKRKPRANDVPSSIQDSPFLSLPGEIRMDIYRAALTRAESIDLWPRNYIDSPQITEAVIQRTKKACPSPCPSGWTPPYFRDQQDLMYVRKEMATGILRCCKQIYEEAADVFWGENTFRFSSDVEWYGARKFLGAIGPRAISRLRSLELFVPVMGYSIGIARRGSLSSFEDILEMRAAKNHPKLHMAKAPKDKTGRISLIDRYRVIPGSHEEPNTSFDHLVLTRNVNHVCYLLKAVGSFFELRLVLPKDFYFQWHENIWRAYHDDPLTRPIVPFSLLAIEQNFASRMLVVVEAGASLLGGVDIPKHFNINGINFICQSGSFMGSIHDFQLAEFVVGKQWMDPSTEYDNLVGVSYLFEISKLPSIPAHGGKVNKNAGPRITKRILKGFGGCKFVRLPGWDCTHCGRTGIYEKVEQRCLCGFYGRCQRDIVQIKKVERAIRKGRIGGEMVVLPASARKLRP